MVWIAENPKYDVEDRRMANYLRARMGAQNTQKIMKLFSLYKYIQSHPPHSAKDIETIAYYDVAQTHPVFQPKHAKKIFSLMKQSGGAGDEALVLDRIIRSMIRYVSGYLPYPLLNLGENVYPYMTILKRAEQIPGIGPYIDIGKEAFVQGTKTTIIGAQDAAKTVGGPAGAAVVAIPAAIGTMFIVATHVLEDELGEAFLVSFLAIPIIGPVLYKAAGSLGKFGRKVFEHKEAVLGTTRTFLGDDIGDTVESYIPNMDARKEEESVQPTTVGAKRFSTRRRKTHKWRRARSVRR